MIGGDAPLVTVAMPAYNHGRFIQESIRGLIAQSYPKIELIVIDDGSSDDTVTQVERLRAECRARFVRFELRTRENRGLCNTLNEALSWAQGTYFAINDSDDVLLPDAITTLSSELAKESDINGVFGGATFVDEEGNAVGVRQQAERYYNFSDILARDKSMISTCGLLRTDAMRRVGGYLDGLYIEDWYIMLKLTERGEKLKLIHAPLARYRLHSTNISKNIDKMCKARFQILDLFSSHAGHNSRKAIVYVETAIDYWRVSKAASVGYLISAVQMDPVVITRPLFRASVARIVLPTAVVDKLKRWKDQRRRQRFTI